MGDWDTDETTLITENPLLPVGERGRSLMVFHHDGVDVVSLVPSVPTTLGRAAGADHVFRGAQLSRRHAQFELVEGTVYVRDLGSTNGTLVNGVRIVEPFPLGFDDEVRLGSVVVKITGLGAAARRTHGLDAHDRFGAALEEELLRARTFGRSFALLMVHAAGAGGDKLHTWVPGVRELVREVDRVGLYGPQIVEICQAEGDLPSAVALAERVVDAQPPDRPRLRCGIAVYPEAGRTADALFAAAREALDLTSRSEPVHVAEACRQVSLVRGGEGDGPIVRSPVMAALYRTATRIAPASIPVLLLGETGTGKEELARHLHLCSSRREAPLHCINCGALPDNLVESVLFGHERGAFTGADSRKEGVFETAHGGTVLLDEIGELPLPAQAALLRVLDTRTLRRVGGNAEIEVDVRVIAATNRDLEAMVAAGTFREDLLFRINAMTLHIPPLRERLADIPALVNHFVDQASFEYGRSISGVSPQALARLLRYPWPGNVRELRNVVQRAVLVALSDRIEEEDLPERLQDGHRPRPVEAEDVVRDNVRDTVAPVARRGDLTADFKLAVKACESALIREALITAEGNHTRAAELLRVPRRTLSYKVHSHDIDVERPDRVSASILERLSEPGDRALPFREHIERIEARLIRAGLARHDRDLARTARELGLHRRTLETKIQKYGL